MAQQRHRIYGYFDDRERQYPQRYPQQNSVPWQTFGGIFRHRVSQSAATLRQPIRSTSSRNFASECRPANEGSRVNSMRSGLCSR
jgi:hypothetical protein